MVKREEQPSQYERRSRNKKKRISSTQAVDKKGGDGEKRVIQDEGFRKREEGRVSSVVLAASRCKRKSDNNNATNKADPEAY
jgi:hypothetical protein